MAYLLLLLVGVGSVCFGDRQEGKTRETHLTVEKDSPLWHDTAAYTEVILTAMHSALAIPIATNAVSSLRRISTGEENSHVRIQKAIEKNGDFEETARPDVLAASYYASVDWNIPGALQSLLVEDMGVKKEWVKGRLPMHPKCAWGIVNTLRRPYNSGKRKGFANDFVGAAWNALDGGAGENSKFMLAMRGYLNKSNEDLFTRIAEKVDWKRITDCLGVLPRSYEKLMTARTEGRACWNFVIDARDMMCSSWSANAWSMPHGGCDLTDGACCDKVNAQFEGYKDDPSKWIYRVHDLAKTVGDILRTIENEEVGTSPPNAKWFRLRQLHVLMKEMVASRVAGGIPQADMWAAVRAGLDQSGWYEAAHEFVGVEDEDDKLTERASDFGGAIYALFARNPPKTKSKFTVFTALSTGFQIIDTRWRDMGPYAGNQITPLLHLALGQNVEETP